MPRPSSSGTAHGHRRPVGAKHASPPPLPLPTDGFRVPATRPCQLSGSHLGLTWNKNPLTSPARICRIRAVQRAKAHRVGSRGSRYVVGGACGPPLALSEDGASDSTGRSDPRSPRTGTTQRGISDKSREQPRQRRAGEPRIRQCPQGRDGDPAPRLDPRSLANHGGSGNECLGRSDSGPLRP